jgi:hypothetical protein
LEPTRARCTCARVHEAGAVVGSRWTSLWQIVAHGKTVVQALAEPRMGQVFSASQTGEPYVRPILLATAPRRPLSRLLCGRAPRFYEKWCSRSFEKQCGKPSFTKRNHQVPAQFRSDPVELALHSRPPAFKIIGAHAHYASLFIDSDQPENTLTACGIRVPSQSACGSVLALRPLCLQFHSGVFYFVPSRHGLSHLYGPQFKLSGRGE